MAQSVSRAPPHHTLPAFLNFNGRFSFRKIYFESSLRNKLFRRKKNPAKISEKSKNFIHKKDSDEDGDVPTIDILTESELKQREKTLEEDLDEEELKKQRREIIRNKIRAVGKVSSQNRFIVYQTSIFA